MPLIETKGAGSAQGFGEFAKTGVVTYIEDVFSTTLYPGTNSFGAVDVGISKLAVTGGLCWFKGRNTNIFAENHKWYDTARASNGGGGTLVCSPAIGSDQAVIDNSGTSTTFYPTGTSITLGGSGAPNNANVNYVVWTFRKQPKFFDIVTYTGTGASSQTINHSLASVPGFIAIKRTDSTGDWVVIARSSSNGQYYCLQNATTPFGFNSTNAAFGTVDFAGMGYLSSTTFLPYVFGGGNSSSSGTNISGATYVAYLFAHNAGGFGLTGTDNVITCGSATSDSNRDVAVTLGWEPQWILWKKVNGADSWKVTDNMRGMLASTTGTDQPAARSLEPNNANSEANNQALGINATGFAQGRTGTAGDTYIYIAIRRGPMKVPTNGTKVFAPVAYTGTGSVTSMSTGSLIVPDLFYSIDRTGTFNDWYFVDRLRGGSKGLRTPATTAEGTFSASSQIGLDVMNSITIPISTVFNNSGTNYINYAFGRAPNFFDIVCYTGTGSATTVTHNLGVVPELMIAKVRSAASQNWPVYSSALGATQYVILDQSGAAGTDTAGRWGGIAPTSTVFSVGAANATNGSGNTYVWYGFATCPGVSKVGSYTGNGSTQIINCGFTGGARFVLIKRTDSIGDWYVYDTARGMTTLVDPYSFTNSTAAESATLGSVTTVSTGFAVNASILAAINTNAASYIFLAIA